MRLEPLYRVRFTYPESWAVGLDGPVSVDGKPLTEPIPGGYTAFSDYEVRYTYANDRVTNGSAYSTTPKHGDVSGFDDVDELRGLSLRIEYSESLQNRGTVCGPLLVFRQR